MAATIRLVRWIDRPRFSAVDLAAVFVTTTAALLRGRLWPLAVGAACVAVSAGARRLVVWTEQRRWRYRTMSEPAPAPDDTNPAA